jgi:protein LSM14
MGGHLLKRKERRAPAGAEAAGVGPDDAKSGEFNFADGLNDFDKQEEFTKMEESAGQEVKGSYQKSSFFDTISCDALDRLEGQRSRMSGADERKLNTETFGAVGLNNRRNFRGRGRGRRGGNRNWNGSSGNWDGTPAGSGRGRNNNSNNGFPRPQAAGP